MLKRKRKRK